MGPETEILKDLVAQHGALKEERSSWDADAESLAKHFLPRKFRLEGSNETNEGGLRTDILDGTGIRATRVASAGMHGGMTSPARPWFRIGLQDGDLSKRKDNRLWLDEVQMRMQTLFSRSNFYQAIHQLYNELIVFGTDFMFEHPDPRNGLRFNALTFGEYVLDTDENGVVDTVFRTMSLTARNIVKMFGYENCSNTIQQSYDKADSRLSRFDVIHAALPREERDLSNLTNKHMPIASYYFEESNPKKFLRESGYPTMPGFGPRWDVTGQDAYGRCPTMDSHGDARMLQSVWATYLKQEHKRADPPVVTPHGLTHANTLPGGSNPVNTVGGTQAMYAVYQVTPDPAGMLQIIQDVRQSIREGMYNDLFKMLAFSPTKQMTATEVAERHEEKLLQLGPVLERLHTELFTPLIDRTFEIMVQEDMVPPWPEDIAGKPIKVDFVSLLAQAQKMVATNAVDQYVGFIGQAAAGGWPEALDIVDIDEVGDGYADYLGIESKMTTAREDREVKREQRNQAQQGMAGAEAAGSAAQTAQTLSNTPVGGEGGGSALDAIMEGVS